MLHRAASNAYSWWWASHIRTKQSKWLEQNLQDMEEKVQDVLKLIEEDGDSFAKRAEMYYKKRPELINFVEESYRAYRALAERYDHISTELQNANNTIAYVFPEQVQFAMEDDEEEATAKFPKKFPPEASKANVPKVPKIPKDFKSVITSATKKLQPKKSMKIAASSTPVVKSGLSKSEGIQEIDKLQKQVLALQTEKEFVKSSYENRLAKYWEIEQQIREIQEKVCSLQDEFGAGTFIKDDEARTLMAAAALKSCQETLAQLQEKEERSAEQAAIEFKRISNAREKLKTLKVEFLPNQIDHDESLKAVEELQNLDQEESSTTKEKQDLELVREKIKEHYEVEFNSSMTVTELAEKIDELVNKVVSLEAAVSSQAALIQRLKTETGGLQSQIQTMEDHKATLTSDKNNLSNKLREMEEKLRRLQDLNQSFEDQNNNLRTHFTEAHCNLDHLSERMHSVKPDEELQVTVPIQSGPMVEVKSQEESKGEESALIKQQNLKLETDLKVTGKEEEEQKEGKGAIHPNDGLEDRQNPDKEHKISDSSQKAEESSAEAGLLNQLEEQEEKTSDSDGTKKGMDTKSEDCKMEGLDPGPSNTIAGENASPLQTSTKREISLGKVCNQKMEEHEMQASPTTLCNTQQQKTMEDDEPDWKQLFTDCLEDRERVLLKEYTTTLRNYKEVKKKLAEAEKGKGDSLFDNTLQLKELKSANAKKDDQIRFLYQKLSLLQANFSEDNESDKSTATESTATEKRIAEDIKLSLLNQQEASSEIEQRFRMNIDEVLEENLDFWMRFSSTFQQIQKFETEVHDLQFELSRLEEKQKKQDGSSTARYSLKSDAKPIYKHLREKHAELSVWLEKSMLLKDELKSRFSSLCDIQEEIMAALKESAEDDDFKFTTHQAAKFQGEILNMKQENNKVADELQAGLDHVTALQLEAEKTLAKLNEVFRLSGSTVHQNAQQQHSESHSRVPLRSFIFGVKQRKHKHSLFSLVQPALHRKHNDFKSGPL